MKNIKRGFTLIELLAVIIILAVIALIITPVINNIIESTRKSAYKSSVDGIVDSASNYVSQYVLNNLNDVASTTFTCDGVSCTNGKSILEFNGDVPKSGTIIVNSASDIQANFITNGKYCASGTKGNITVTSSCSYLDTTAPIINSDYTLQSTSNSVIVTIPSGYASDSESNITSYRIDLYNGSTLVKETIRTDINSNITESFNSLNNSITYQVIVTAVNGNNLETSRSKTIKTGDITNPSISYTNTPTTAINGYYTNQVINVTYSNNNISNPIYYIKTTRTGISSLNITSSCGTDTMPGSCTSISTTTTLSANTWYQVTGNISVTYNTTDNNTGTIYAITYDGTNYSGSVTGTISKIDNSVPTVSTTVSNNVGTLTMADANSGVSSYCINTSNSSSSCSWINITNSTNATANYTASSANTYYAFSKDAMGNISLVSSFVIPTTAFCAYSAGQTWTYSYNGGIQTFTTPCTGLYKLEVWGAQGGSSSATGGYGGYSVGYKTLNSSQALYIAVGGAGSGVTGGYNGGGTGHGNGNGGGGATSITTTNRGVLSNYASYTGEILMVAGGGGGAGISGITTPNGGSGGGTSGANGAQAGTTGDYGYGASQSGAGGSAWGAGYGAFGVGGSNTSYGSAGTGGGGGYYGGGAGTAGTNGFGASGGGSGYIGGVPSISYNGTNYSPSTSNGAQAGNGYVKITLVSY